jgi:3',5'-cyclic AMP phosphodiesterase CpdA
VPGAAAADSEVQDWRKGQLGPGPPTGRGGKTALAEIIGDAATEEIEKVGEIRFHALGDSGVGHAEDAEEVANEMATDFKPGANSLNPAFLFHLGDVIYGVGKQDHYGERFYRPYQKYPGKILAIPGNHDGEVKSDADSPSLKAFRDNFCTAKAEVPAQAAGSGIFRQTMTQPGVYWMLDAPFVRVIGLYSNRIEDKGFLEGRDDQGRQDRSQLDWLKQTLAELAGQPRKALIVATHHPPYSLAGHASSPEMTESVDEACRAAGVWPDAFLSGHAHNYQLHIRHVESRQIPYFVAGTGGMRPQKVPPATGQPTDGTNGVTYEKAVASLGYLFVTVSARQLKVEFWELGEEHIKPFNTVTVDLAANTATSV